jgi:hypothetical protein
MNIFILDTNPRIAAKMHCDKHVPKMILETAQMLSTAHHVYDTPQAPFVYKKAHLNHPCTIWVRESVDNYSWAFELFRELNNEFFRRRGKKHLSWVKLKEHLSHTPSLPLRGLTPFAQAMPDHYKQEDTVEAYRAYYRGDKASFAKWEWPTAQTPSWWKSSKFSQVGR